MKKKEVGSLVLPAFFVTFAVRNKIQKTMEENKNKYIAVAYKLFSNKDGQVTMEEEATADLPFVFISGFGFTIDAFEKELVHLAEGDNFDFTLAKEEAYGDIDSEGIVDFDRELFYVDGKFDEEHVALGAILPLQNEQGQRFFGKVLDITDKKVKLDFNHPLAGKSLNFVGKVIESREATTDEIQSVINQMSGGCGGCGGGCSSCSEGCEGKNCNC